MARVQGSLEYLIIISVVLAVTAIVTLIVVNSFGSQETHYLYNTCVAAAKTCRTSLVSDSNAQCSFCDNSCNFTNGTEIFQNATQCCKQGNDSGIYDGSFGCKLSCSDGTPYGKCSDTQPWFCTGAGTLINDCINCLCPSDHACNTTTKKCYPACDDGTPYGKCSADKPKYCSAGSWINDCVACNCPSGQECNTITKECYVPACKDGTPINQCANPSGANRGKLCDSTLNLVDNCPACSCGTYCCNSAGKTCFLCCGDGTPAGTCSSVAANLGKYCLGTPPTANFQDMCHGCGACPTGMYCPAGAEKCLPICGDAILASGEACDPTASGNTCTCRQDCNCAHSLSLVMGKQAGVLPGYVQIVDFYEATQLCPDSPSSADKLGITPTPDFKNPMRIKAADVNNDGKTELIVSDNALSTLTIYDNRGTYIKRLNIGSDIGLVDFAIIDSDGDTGANLVILTSQPTIQFSLQNISSYSDYYTLTLSNFGHILWPAQTGYELLKALYVNGKPAVAAMQRGAAPYVSIYTMPTSGSTYTLTYYARFNPPGSCKRVMDFDFADWNLDGIRKELVILSKEHSDIPQGCNSPSNNDMWIFDITKMGSSGTTFNLATANDPTLNYTWLNAKDDHAEEMYVEDLDGDGKDEIITMDTSNGNNARSYSNNCGNSIGTAIPDASLGSCLERTDDVMGAGCANDMAAIGVLTGYGPKIA